MYQVTLQDLQKKIESNAIIMGADLVPLLQLIQAGVNPPPFGGDLAAVLGAGDDGGGLNIANVANITADSLTSRGVADLSLVSSGTSLFLDTGGTLAVTNTADVDFSALTGFVKLKNGGAGSVAIGNAIDNGFIFGANTASIVTNGVEKWMVNSSGALNPILPNTYDIGGSSSIRDIGVGRNVIVGGIVSAAAGAVGAPSYTFTGNTTDGFYSVSGTQIGVAVNGALVAGWNATGIFTGVITEQVGAAGVTISGSGIMTDQGTLSGQGMWKLGQVTVGVATLDTVQYLEVEVGGNLVKLLMST